MVRKLVPALVLLGLVFVAYYLTASPGEGPPKDKAVYLELDRSAYGPGDTMRLRVVNSGDENITTGYHFLLYRREGDTWREVKVPLVFIEIAVIVRPGESWEQEINLAELNLPPGHYKITKRVWGEKGYFDVEAEFDVNG